MTEPVLLKRPQIREEAWDRLIGESTDAILYAHTWYLDCVSPKWQALVWPSEQEYCLVMPLPVKTKWGLQSIQQPLFCQYLGIFSRTPPASDQILAFLKAVHRHFKYISVYHFQPSLFPLLLQLMPLFPGFLPSTHSTDWLSLSPPYPELYRGYSQDRKKNLKKSMRFAWHCHTRPEIAPLIRLFRENHERQIVGGVHPQAYTLLQKLADLLLEKQIASIVYAELEGQIRAGIMMMESYGKIIYIFNAADTVGRKGNARTFLLNRYIQLKANTNAVLDFESPEIESIAHFYRSFGATPKYYMALKMNRLPFLLQYLQHFRQWFMKRQNRIIQSI